MIMEHQLLALLWGGIIAFGIIMYVILDGFDLGIGIIMPFFKERKHHDLMVSTILPVWDGNETWIVFGGAALYGAFPLAFSTILPLIYMPIFLMMIGLLFRGVAFEFRLKVSPSGKNIWDTCFFAGSLLATLSQGYILGEFIQGFQKINYAFNFFCAITLVFGYMLLGSNRLISKTENDLQQKCFILSGNIQYVIAGACFVVSIWTPFLDKRLFDFWFDIHKMLYLSILPALTIFLLGLHIYAIKNKWEHSPFWLSIGIFLMCYIGFILSSYPYVIPGQLTYLEACAPTSTLLFMSVGAFVMLPVLLFYTAYSYRIFRGKVREKIGY